MAEEKKSGPSPETLAASDDLELAVTRAEAPVEMPAVLAAIGATPLTRTYSVNPAFAPPGSRIIVDGREYVVGPGSVVDLPLQIQDEVLKRVLGI